MGRITSFISTLYRKRVFQIAIVYVGVAWAGLEMTDFAISNYDLSRKLLDVAVFLLIMGLPAVLIIGWYHGEKGHQSVTGTEMSLLLTLFVMAAVGTYQIATAEEMPSSGSTTADQTPAEGSEAPVRLASRAGDLGANSIAVFAFQNKADQDSLDWLGPALADMLTTNLAQLESVRVVSRERLLELLGDAGLDDSGQIPPVRAHEIAESSGARLMIRGSLLATEGELVVDAQLIELEEGTVLAAERARGSDVFALADEVSEKLSAALPGEAAKGRPMAPIATVTTPNLAAYKEYYKGIAAERAARMEEAKRQFEKALERDSSFGLALLRLSEHGKIDSTIAVKYQEAAATRLARLSREYGPQLRALVQVGEGSLRVTLDSLLASVESLSVVTPPVPARPDTSGGLR